MIARRTTGVVTTVLAGALLAACASPESESTGCHGEADGGIVVVQGQTSTLAGDVAAGVGSIDVDPESASAMLLLSQGADPGKVRSVLVEVGTVFRAAGADMTVVQICRGSLTVEASTATQ